MGGGDILKSVLLYIRLEEENDEKGGIVISVGFCHPAVFQAFCLVAVHGQRPACLFPGHQTHLRKGIFFFFYSPKCWAEVLLWLCNMNSNVLNKNTSGGTIRGKSTFTNNSMSWSVLFHLYYRILTAITVYLSMNDTSCFLTIYSYMCKAPRFLL